MKKISLLILLIFVLAGCSDIPDESEIQRQLLEQKLDNGVDTIFGIESFEKTNGYEKSPTIYIADVQYEIVFRKGLNELKKELVVGNSPLESMQAELFFASLAMQYGNFEAGYRVQRTEKITFLKTENGWMIE
jgi:hypothetical protein